MISIFIQDDSYKAEREYILGVMLGDFLGMDYEVFFHEEPNYKIQLKEGKELIIKDDFFIHYQDKSYLEDMKVIPVNISRLNFERFKIEDLPIIYGNNKLEIFNSKVFCEVDLFASSFFMLTRFEEYMSYERDEHHRFQAKDSLAWKHDFLNRPVVNEYLELLWNCILVLDPSAKRIEKKFKIIPSHDIDRLHYFPLSKFGTIKTMIGHLVKRKDVKRFINELRYGVKKVINNLDPYDTFDELCEISEKNNWVSEFYFMGATRSNYDNGYDLSSPYTKEKLKKINNKNHKIGFHPGYYTYNDDEIWAKENKRIQEIFSDINIPKSKIGRQHYLKFDIANTWRIWERNGYILDSTLGFPEKEGFRCGVCYEYPVFDVIRKKKLKLFERPLIIMDGTFFKYQNELSEEQIFLKINELKNKVKKYNGIFTVLTHNTMLSKLHWPVWNNIYKRILAC